MIERLGKRGLRMFLGAAAIFVVGAGVAWAAIPGSSGVINGCYEKRTGILRVIDAEAGKRCLSFETAISWNQGGTAGPQGPAGSKGPPGDKGPTGDKGPQGNPGAAGDKGPQGDPGASGDKGAIGDKGAPGDQGPIGDKGPHGDPGDKGLVGDKGPTGDKGPQGDPGDTTNFHSRVSASTSLPHHSSTFITVACEAGEVAVGGGASNVNALGVHLKQSAPTPGGGNPTATGWIVSYENTTAGTASGRAYVICAGP